MPTSILSPQGTPAVNADSAGFFTNLPTWARVAGIIGLPGFFASWLLYFFTHTQAAGLEAHATLLSTHIAETRVHDAQFASYLAEHKIEIETMRAILSQICVNGAVTREDKSKCNPIPVPKVMK